MIEDVYLTAPDGPVLADVRLYGVWPWILVALGAAVVAIGALLL